MFDLQPDTALWLSAGIQSEYTSKSLCLCLTPPPPPPDFPSLSALPVLVSTQMQLGSAAAAGKKKNHFVAVAARQLAK